MKIKKLGPNMTELGFSDGTRVLVSYETPVAAYVPAPDRSARTLDAAVRQWGWIKSARYYSRTTAQHVAQWLTENGAQDVQTVPAAFIESLMEGR